MWNSSNELSPICYQPTQTMKKNKPSDVTLARWTWRWQHKSFGHDTFISIFLGITPSSAIMSCCTAHFILLASCVTQTIDKWWAILTHHHSSDTQTIIQQSSVGLQPWSVYVDRISIFNQEEPNAAPLSTPPLLVLSPFWKRHTQNGGVSGLIRRQILGTVLSYH